MSKLALAIRFIFEFQASWVLVGHKSDANFVPPNTADNWLHLFLGIGMVALGMLGYRATRTDRVRA